MDNFYFIGVDVSKKKQDFCVLFEGKVLREEQVSNHQQAVARPNVLHGRTTGRKLRQAPRATFPRAIPFEEGKIVRGKGDKGL